MKPFHAPTALRAPLVPGLRALALALAAWLATAALAEAAPQRGWPSVDQRDGPRARAAGRYVWAELPSDRGPVRQPRGPGQAATDDGWTQGPNNYRYRPIPSWSGDPTYEVIVGAPESGHPTLSERFVVQFPVGWTSKPMEERAVVLAFHGFSVSEKSVFINSELPYVCRDKGWMLVAPYGLLDTNFASVEAQASYYATLELLSSFLPYEESRIYAVGFSMGGLCAISFAMRHQDPDGLRIAAVVAHTPLIDLKRNYHASDEFVQEIMVDDEHFGGPPEEVPFAYEQLSPALYFDNGLVDGDHAPVSNMLHVPFYLHANLADPNDYLVSQLMELENYLLLRGATVRESLAFDAAAGHSWSTLDEADALDWAEPFRLPDLPDAVEIFADDAGVWHHSEVRAKPPGVHARYRLLAVPPGSFGTGAFKLTESRSLDAIAVHVAGLGLDPTQELRFVWSAADATGDRVVLTGYASAPQEVRLGAVPLVTWTWDAPAQELAIDLAAGSSPGVVTVVP